MKSNDLVVEMQDRQTLPFHVGIPHFDVLQCSVCLGPGSQLYRDLGSPRLCFPRAKDLPGFARIKDPLNIVSMKELLSFAVIKNLLNFARIKDLLNFARIQDLLGFAFLESRIS
nr:hypothetical protein CFP56_33174 [Quercus suber]